MQTALGRQMSSGGRFTWTGLAVMIVSAPLVGLTFARVGEVIQSYLVPSALVSILMGAFIGLTIVAITRFGRFGHRPTIFSATVAAAIVAAVGNEAMGGTGVSPVFWSDTGKMPVPPTAFFALLAAVTVTIPAVRAPYCNRCGSWFRTVRNGKIDLPTSRRLAELLGVEQPGRVALASRQCPAETPARRQCHPPVRSSRYRLSACRGDCGPTRCELSWERSGGGVDLARVWLDGKQRSEVVSILDELSPNECEAASGKNNAKPQAADPNP